MENTAKKDLDWGNLTFSYMPTDYSYVVQLHATARGRRAVSRPSTP